MISRYHGTQIESEAIMRLEHLKNYMNKNDSSNTRICNECICIINDNKYDYKLGQEISHMIIHKQPVDFLLITKGIDNSIHYLYPFFYITYTEATALTELYQEFHTLRNNQSHKKCINIIAESLASCLLQGTNTSMLEDYIDALNFNVVSGGCILFKHDALTEAKRIQIQLSLYITKGIFCLFYEQKKSYVTFLFSSKHLEIADTKEIAAYLHSFGLDKTDVGISSVKHELSQFHDAYIEGLLDFENHPVYSISIQDNSINYTLSIIAEKMTRNLEKQDVEALRQNIDEYMEFLFQLKSIQRIDVTIQLLHHLYERFYLIKNAQPIRDMIKEIENNNMITSELDTIYNTLRDVLIKMMSMMSERVIENNALINQIYEYVKVNYRQPLGLKAVADAFQVTPQYVCKLFSKYTSTNFSALLTYFRIYHAKLLLKNGFTIKEVADVCGYHDVGYFMKKFKSVTGLTANEYKNSINYE